MDDRNVIGLDLAKSVFQVQVNDARGKKLAGKRLRRGQLLEYFAAQPPALVGMEACGGAHEWGRRLQALGHEVKLMAPQHVKAYVQRDKSDARDAAAITEATARPAVPAIAVRSVASQQMQAMHRVRQLWVKQRNATTNQIRGLLAEFGQVAPQGHSRLRGATRAWLSQVPAELAPLQPLIEDLLQHWTQIEQRMAQLEAQILQWHRDNEACRWIDTVPGVGMLTATAVVARFGRAESYPSARQFACALGLTPREHSSGEKQVRLGISKRGDRYLRQLLVHGARAVLRARLNRPAHADDWVVKLARRRGHNIAVVALAAKNARCIWALLRRGQTYRTAGTQAAA